MAERELRIKATMNVAEAKASIAQLTREELGGITAVANARAKDAQIKTDLTKLQLAEAKAAGQTADQVKAIAQALKSVQNEQRAATAEARLFTRELQASERAARQAEQATRRAKTEAARVEKEKEQVKDKRDQDPLGAHRSAMTQKLLDDSRSKDGPDPDVLWQRPDGNQPKDRKISKPLKYMLTRLGIPEGAMEGGNISPEMIQGALSAAIVTAITAGFASISRNGREAEHRFGSSAAEKADLQDELAAKARDTGMGKDQTARLLGKISSTRGVASETEMLRAAIGAWDERGSAGAEEAVRKAAAGPDAATPLQQANQTARRRRRDFEISRGLAEAGNLEATADDDLAQQQIDDLYSRDGVTVPGWAADKLRGSFIGEAIGGMRGDHRYAGPRGRLDAMNRINGGVLLGRNGEGSQFTPIKVEVSNAPRPLNRD